MEDNVQYIADLQPGMTLNHGKYTIEKRIGGGGFGITYKARQNGLNREVCIKEYFLAGRCMRQTERMTVVPQNSDINLYEKYRQAFVKEAQTLAELQHPGIVDVIDVFDENGTSYMVMNYIQGRSLQNIVEEQGPLPYTLAVNYIAQVAEAVAYIHERHILHRDIKPENIMITADHRAILIDFGSAREFVNDKTQAHTSILTHGYAPTEQYSTTSRKGSYTDIYAIGATLYFILTGTIPMDAAARMTEDMPEPKSINTDIPDNANRTIMKAMQIKATERHQSVQEFMDDLRNIKPTSVEQSIAASEESAPQKATVKEPDEKDKTNTVWLDISGAFIGILIIVAVIMISTNKNDENSYYNSYSSDYNTSEVTDPTPVTEATVEESPAIEYDYADSCNSYNNDYSMPQQSTQQQSSTPRQSAPQQQQITTPQMTQVWVNCFACGGSGHCMLCGGSGILNIMGYVQPCTNCSGTGICTTCFGSKGHYEYRVQ